jgi:hypothetical protein
MVSMAGAIADVIIVEKGEDEMLRLLADPLRFQAFSCVLGFDWHSSGTTTVVMAALREAMGDSGDIAIAGGKGRQSLGTLKSISGIADRMDLAPSPLVYASRLTAKVDNALVQDSYSLYHHTIAITSKGNWAVVQQGLSHSRSWARRYHWIDGPDLDYVIEPHAGMFGSLQPEVLDMTDRGVDAARSASVDLVNDGIHEHRSDYIVRRKGQSLLEDYTDAPQHMVLPSGINWPAVREAYDRQVEGYEELVAVQGIGPSTVRALALISELVHGTPLSWKDPLKYTFTVGGKDGVPYPVDRKAMDETTSFIREGLEKAKVGDRDRLRALERLRNYLPPELASSA